jgi:pimeloyl-ACP methyl ester carboxylesterase
LARLSRTMTSGFGREGRLAWRVWGRGKPLVLLHGGYGSWRHWARNIDALSQRYELWIPDLPGLGASASAPEDAGPEEIARFVLEGLQELGALEALSAIAGFSFGSIIAGHLAAQAVVPSLVLVGASGLGASRSPVQLEKLPAGGWESEAAAVHRKNLEALMIADPAQVDALAVAIQTANVGEARFKSVRFSRSDNLLLALRETRARRISAIWGENDAVAKGAIPERIALLETIPQFRSYEVIAGAGHWVMYEAASSFDDALLRLIGT